MKFARLLLFTLALSSLSLTGCKSTQQSTSSEKIQTTAAPRLSDHTIQAVLWQQTSAEYVALSYQAFSIAKLRLDEFLEEKGNQGKTPAIITDIDETVLDNTPSSANNIKQNEEYSSEEWAEWVAQESAKEVPGAAEFLNYAAEKGVEIFYVSNRIPDAEEATLRNMKTVNFPYADKAHLYFRTDGSSKKDRFDEVRKDYDVIMYMGDNLSDFSHEFEATSVKKRKQVTDKYKSDWGKRFIVLPNPIYGDWENKAIFKDKYDWTPQEKDSIRRANLKSY